MKDSLASVAQLGGEPSHKQEAAGSIPGRGTCPGCGFSPQWGATNRFLSHINVSLSLATFFTLSLKSISKSAGKDKKNETRNEGYTNWSEE